MVRLSCHVSSRGCHCVVRRVSAGDTMRSTAVVTKCTNSVEVTGRYEYEAGACICIWKAACKSPRARTGRSRRREEQWVDEKYLGRAPPGYHYRTPPSKLSRLVVGSGPPSAAPSSAAAVKPERRRQTTDHRRFPVPANVNANKSTACIPPHLSDLRPPLRDLQMIRSASEAPSDPSRSYVSLCALPWLPRVCESGPANPHPCR